MAPINRGFITAGRPHRRRHRRRARSSTSATTSSNAGWQLLRRGGHRSRARPGAQPPHRVLHLDRDRARSGRSPRRRAPARPRSSCPASAPASSRRVCAIIAIAIALGVGIALGGGNIQFTFYLVALTGMGMLATTGVVVSEDTFGPVADNAAGIAEMSGEFEGEPERIMVSLDAVGNTTKAVTKGFAIGSAVIAVGRAVRVLHRDHRRRARTRSKDVTGNRLFNNILTQINVADPKTFIGLLIGGSIVVPLLGARDPRGRSHRRRRRAGGPAASSPTARSWPAPRSPTTARSSTSAPRRRCVSSPRRRCSRCSRPVIIGFGINFFALGAFLAGGDPHRSAHGQLPVELRWRVGQREEVHRGRPRGRQGLRGAQGRRHR